MEEFRRDARNVKLRISDNFIEDVTDVLKRFFRELEDPIFTLELHPQWKEAAGTSFTQPCSTLGSLGPVSLRMGSRCQPWCRVTSGSAGFGQIWDLVFLPPEIPSKPQRLERYKELIHRLPRLNHKTLAALIGHLYRSVGTSPQGPLVQPALWGLPAAQGMLAPIPKRHGGPHARALLPQPPSWCWNMSGTP